LRLIVTGGGTGGHVYPALEVARLAAVRGARIAYFGSFRGQERAACVERDILFVGFASEPLYSLKSFAGIRALVRLQQARIRARRYLKAEQPDVVFSTGGYSAGPVVAAARDLKIPYIVHSADSVPPRSTSMFAREAYAFTTLFRSTPKFYTVREVIRTGQPIRRELREPVLFPKEKEPIVLVLGGSQGSEFLNKMMPFATAQGQFSARVLHATGPKNLETTRTRLAEAGLGSSYQTVAYLETSELAKAMQMATVVVSRSGGTLAELALFGLPSVLIPLPSSANDHQLNNAREFAEMGAATILWQPEDKRQMAPPATPEAVSLAIRDWIEDASKRSAASHNLKDWDIPDATERIVTLIEEAASSAGQGRKEISAN
jgi:UDP-N-acetylglucosamine--N-acetylmuramyl-(pentapeptide) pyrophosphoryl-undecaprenol N-acetylglucosamine transferase